MKILQLNLNHCEAAQDLLTQTVCEHKIDVAIICEQYKNLSDGTWLTDTSNKVAIWACGKETVQEKPLINQSYYIRAKIGGIHIFSCYMPPSLQLREYESILDNLVRDALLAKPHIIAGDFNAWSTEWGSKKTNPRGSALLKAFSLLDAVLLNSGTENTFEKNGRGSIIDIAFASSAITRTIEWKINDLYTHSDHRAVIIETDIKRKSQRKTHIQKAQTKGWKDNTLDEEMFVLMLDEELPNTTGVNEKANQLVRHISQACDAAMIRKRETGQRKPAYWWNDEIAVLRGRCLKARRQQQRKRGTVDYERLLTTFKQARKEFKIAIKRSKNNSFKELCSKADENPWGGAYKVVMSKIRGGKSQAPSCTLLMRKIVDTLFPLHPVIPPYELQTTVNHDEQPILTHKEVILAAERFENNKTPGLDGIPNRVLKIALRHNTAPFTDLYTKCLLEGIFPKIWKRQRLVLIPKPNKPPGEPSSYRPLCMIDTLGKVLERIICERLEKHIENVGGLADNQYGFRKKRSTVDAIKKLTEIAGKAIQGARWMGGTKEYCAVITLDIRNAFNTVNWSHIMRALERLNTPAYLLRIIGCYLSERLLWYDTADGVKYHEITGGVPQGSVLGPLLWNVVYDGVLRLPLPKGVQLVGYADDIAVTVVAKEIANVQRISSSVAELIKNWLTVTNLELAGHKTEAVLITSRKKRETTTLIIDGHEIQTQSAIRYLGVMIDTRLSFKTNIETACEKAARVHSALARIMTNIGGPNQKRRILLGKVTQSIAMYAAPVWAQALQQKTYAQKMKTLFRLSALRVCSAFRTVSHEASSVISGIMPPHIQAPELQRVYERGRNSPLTVEERNEERRKSIAEWQQEWDIANKGRWTHRLIKNVSEWVNRKHGNTDFYMTQFLSGHGCFREYLHKYGHDTAVTCPYCEEGIENAEHIFFICPKFEPHRKKIEDLTMERITPDTIVPQMLRSKEVWEMMEATCASVLQELRKMEQLRRSETQEHARNGRYELN